ncbi:MAG: integral membrane protein MviN, partial [Parcubacteria group bacterium Gr01-1014_38]
MLFHKELDGALEIQGPVRPLGV